MPGSKKFETGITQMFVHEITSQSSAKKERNLIYDFQTEILLS